MKDWPLVTPGASSSADQRVPDWARRRLAWALWLGCSIALACVPLGALAQTEDHPYTTTEILAGAQLYSNNCQPCHSLAGDGIPGVNLSHQQFKRDSSDEDIRNTIHNGVAGAAMPAFTALQRSDLDALVAFIRSGFDQAATTIRLGDKDRGRRLFEGKAGCANCHHLTGDGPVSAPSLAAIGAQRLPGDIQRTILDPTAAMLPINRPVRVVLRDGRTLQGRRLNQDSFTVQLIDYEHQLVTIDRRDIGSLEIGTASAMPAYAGKLTEREVSDLLAYLVTLKGQ